MEDEDIILRYHKQERNKKIVEQYFKDLSDNNWERIEDMYQSVPIEFLTLEALKFEPAEILNLNDADWRRLRSEEFKVHERFSERRRVLDASSFYPQPTAERPLASIEEILLQEEQERRKEIIEVVKWENRNKNYKVLNLIAEDNVVYARLIVKDIDPKLNMLIEYPSSCTLYLKKGCILRDIYMPHLLSELIQLGKISGHTDSEAAQDYIESLKNLGFIE